MSLLENEALRLRFVHLAIRAFAQSIETSWSNYVTDTDLDKLIDHIDYLMERRLAARGKKAKMTMLADVDIDKILQHGAYPPDDPSSGPRLALLVVGETLGRVGGKELMLQVLQAYSNKYGSAKAGRLSDRWQTAAGIWD